MIYRFNSSFFSQLKTRYSRGIIGRYSNYFEFRNDCNICGNNNLERISKRDRYGCFYPLNYCLDCYNVFSLIFLKKEKLAEYYNGKANQIKIIKDPKFLFKNRISQESYAFDRFNFISENLKKELKKNTLIVEIGCSDGSNLYPFEIQNYNVLGFDFNSKRIDIGKSYGLNLIQINSNKLVFSKLEKNRSHKLVYLSHLIEHLTDFYEYFKNLVNSMCINDLIFIETPCIDYVLNYNKNPFKLYPKDTNLINYLQLEHTYFFQEDQLNKLISLFGFRKLVSNDIYRGLFVLECKNYPERKAIHEKMADLFNPKILQRIIMLENKYKSETGKLKYIYKHIY